MDDQNIEHEPEASGQMSFLEHLDELRKRLVKSVLILIAAFLICFNFSNDIYNFLYITIIKALN